MSDESAHYRSKRPRSIVAGPYGHPFHGLLVTIPIGTWIASLIFDIVGAVNDEPGIFGPGATWLIGIGIVGALLAAIVGFIDLSGLAAGTKARKIALTHMGLNLGVVILFVVGFLVRTAGGYDSANVAGIVISIVALVLLTGSGVLGGELAYRYGVRVADEQTQSAGFGGSDPQEGRHHA